MVETANLFSCSQISNGIYFIPAIGIKENRRERKAILVDHIRENSLIVAIYHII